MVFAWSVAEIVRYATYALALFNIKIYPLEWLRCVSITAIYSILAASTDAIFPVQLHALLYPLPARRRQRSLPDVHFHTFSKVQVWQAWHVRTNGPRHAVASR